MYPYTNFNGSLISYVDVIVYENLNNEIGLANLCKQNYPWILPRHSGLFIPNRCCKYRLINRCHNIIAMELIVNFIDTCCSRQSCQKELTASVLEATHLVSISL